MKKQRKSNKFYLPIRETENIRKVTLEETDEETYFALMRPVWRKRKKMQRDGSCGCPGNKLQFCDGDCGLCDYYAVSDNPSEISTETPTKHNPDFNVGDTLKSNLPNPGDELEKSELTDALNRQLAMLNEIDYQICVLAAQGYSKREIADKIDKPWTTAHRRINALFDNLADKLKDYR